jgi:RHS repeat-associated protein
MTSKDGTAYTYGENGAGPHAVTAIGDNTYTCDANGNMTSCQEAGGSPVSGPSVTVTITATPVQAPVATATVHITATPVQATTTTYTWDVENRLTGVSGGASFVYDGDGNRVKSRFIKIIRDFESRDSQKTEGGETILYVNKYYEKNLTTSVVTTNYYLGDRLIATRAGTTLTYVHQDALTGTSVTTNSSGTSTGSIKYFSFGQARSGSVSTPQKFTGQRLDTTGLYYYGARYYDPTIGRFISADRFIQNLANPQMLNRYSYCINNPLKCIYPSGHIVWFAVIAVVLIVVNVASVGYDIYQCINEPSVENYQMLGLDALDPSPVPWGGLRQLGKHFYKRSTKESHSRCCIFISVIT